MRAVPALLLLLVVFALAPAPTRGADWTPPEALTVRWLEPSAGALLVRWRQRGDADKTTVLRCYADRPTVCKPYAELYDHIPGLRWAVIPAQPGDLVRVVEWDYLGVDGWGERPTARDAPAPLLDTLLPVVY